MKRLSPFAAILSALDRGGAVADHKLEGQTDGSRSLTREDGKKKAHGCGPHLGPGLADRGQGGDAGLREMDVVEADDGDVARHAKDYININACV
jgi:hypothetical protein